MRHERRALNVERGSRSCTCVMVSFHSSRFLPRNLDEVERSLIFESTSRPLTRASRPKTTTLLSYHYLDTKDLPTDQTYSFPYYACQRRSRQSVQLVGPQDRTPLTLSPLSAELPFPILGVSCRSTLLVDAISIMCNVIVPAMESNNGKSVGERPSRNGFASLGAGVPNALMYSNY